MKRIGGVILCGLLLSSCYTFIPVASQAPLLGSSVVLDITDAGRASLGGTMGPEIGEIEGRLVSMDASEYTLAVSVVRFLRGGEQTWTGERVRVKNEFVSTVKEKKFSRRRTAVIAGVALGVVAVFVTRAIVGSGSTDIVTPPVDTTSKQNRIPRH